MARFLSVFLFIAISCNHISTNDNKLLKEIDQNIKILKGKELIFPKSLIIVNDDGISPFVNYDQYGFNIKIISTINGNCDLCVYEIKKWETLSKIINDSNLPEKIFFIIKDTEPNYFRKLYYPELNHSYNFLLDPLNEFSKINNFPKIRVLQTVITDSLNKVIFIGDPFNNDKLKKLFIGEIQKINFKSHNNN